MYDSNYRDATYARPDGGTSSPGYFAADTMTSINDELKIKNEKLNEETIYNLAGQERVNGQMEDCHGASTSLADKRL